MQEWMEGGARLGWYIDPYARRVYIYRPGQEVEVLDNPQTLSGEDVLPGFVFEVTRLVFDRYRS
jgi:Uma2 family endonuclease